MYAFYQEETGTIISLVDASDVPLAPEGYGYVNCNYSLDEIYKYQVIGGIIKSKPQDVIDEIEATTAWDKIRKIRSKLLSASDWTQSPDSPLSEAQQQSWRDYRQALRDLPENTTDPLNPTWPSKPS